MSPADCVVTGDPWYSAFASCVVRWPRALCIGREGGTTLFCVNVCLYRTLTFLPFVLWAIFTFVCSLLYFLLSLSPPFFILMVRQARGVAVR